MAGREPLAGIWAGNDIMAEKPQHEIAKDLKELYERGKQAYERNNLEYAIQLQELVLKREPGFYEAREALRATQFKKLDERKGFLKKLLGSAGSSPLLAKAQIALHTNPAEALHLCESILNKDPHHAVAHKTLAAAAMKLELHKTAVLSLELAYKQCPEDKDIGLRLGEALVATRNTGRAQKILKELNQAHPNDAEVFQAYKDCSANHTLQEGRYEGLEDGQGSYRDILRDKEQAIVLEQEQRTVKTDDVALRMIEDQLAILNTEPGHLKALQRVAELYSQLGDIPKARKYYEELILHTEGIPDPILIRDMDHLALREIDQQLDSLNQDAGEQTASRRADLLQERSQLELAQCQKRANQYPNDLHIKFELGQIHYRLEQYKEAIPLFQKAQANPNLRLKALHHLGKSFFKRGITDLALQPILTAIQEKEVFDDQKKELLYDLGLIHDQLGNQEEAMEQFKLIYGLDITYKDVADRVETYYLQ